MSMSLFFLRVLISILAAQVRALHFQGKVDHEPDRPWRIKAYYINVNTSVGRASCMQAQLDQLQVEASKKNFEIESERFPAAVFSSKCEDTESCIADMPSCFPSGRGFASHGKNLADQEEMKGMIRGVFGDACSHLRVLQKISQESKHYDYFLVLEDDVGISMGILDSLSKLFSLFPDHWTMITIDSFPWPKRSTPEPDIISPKLTRGLPLTGISATRQTNWGSQAWLLNSRKVDLFLQYYETQPTMNTDWYTKIPRPLHLGIWGFTPGQLQQLRFVSESTFSALPFPCHETSVINSDIAKMAFLLRPQVRQLSLQPHRLPDVAPKSKEVLLFGMPGTHVNRFRTILPRNSCRYRDSVGGCNGVPSDLPPEDWYSTIANYSNLSHPLKQTVAVVVVRHPLALAEELAQTEVSGCDTLKCSPKCKAHASLWMRIICQWNSAMMTYARVARKGTFHKVVFLRYEDILASPNIAAERVAEAAGSQQSDEIVDLHVQRLEFRTYAKVDLNRLQYKTKDACSRLQTMCNHINREILWEFGYHGCQWFSSNFTDQVFEGASSKPEHFAADCQAFRDPLEDIMKREGRM